MTASSNTSAHAMLRVFQYNGIDRVFVVPGESYLGILDALSDFPGIDVVTCRHESGAGFMAAVDGRLTGRPGVVMVSRGPGACNAAISIHTAQQDAVPLIMVVGQVAKRDLRKGAFQEIDYQHMYGSIAKWVCEVTASEDLATAAFKAVRIATSGTPGPVVLVVPEDVQQQAADQPEWKAVPAQPAMAGAASLASILGLIVQSARPLIITGSAMAVPGGREALLALATHFQVPVAVSFRGHDLFPNDHPLYAGNLDLANPAHQMEAFASSDLIIALGTRLGDITTQGYTFPSLPRPRQTVVHCHADGDVINQHFTADIGLAADPVELARALAASQEAAAPSPQRQAWIKSLRGIHEERAAWPQITADDGVPFVDVVKCLHRLAPAELSLCLDAGTFAAPVYRHFAFRASQRLLASFSGSMGYGTPAAVVAGMRDGSRKVVCMVGDGGFLMTGNEILVAVDRQLPILFVLSNNNCYGSIRIHQDRTYPGRHVGTTLNSPDFIGMARSFGLVAELVENTSQIEPALQRGLDAKVPYFIAVRTSLAAVLRPKT